MNKMVKKGFSMIELLFVMVILAALAAIAIPSMSSGTESATLTSMRSDMKNIMALLQSKYVDTQDYSVIIGSEIKAAEANDSGFASDPLVNSKTSESTNIPLSQGNSVTITANTAAEGSCTAAGQGFEISISNTNVPGKTTKFNSCTDGKIIMEVNNAG